ncbi:nicotinate-nucleotide adenylyltransferase [Modicisalibacter ilicicola DSM 19980]|uniref:Probable nicotinate-nucleotide adenylyltransferase n=2 Tax=Modicisalibacter ilicicola TaxID=480814 RepID=A0A1M5BUY0_9GAMM|nr:nicotinate-nucleotide adenylyltransferase [Halomonas ilicicola]SHF46220.1 nicotinate-nucleotide adenylyltransferase [Halomonas ilicicola DSM 19980]
MSVSEDAPVRVAMLGGTFDPVHIGHLRSAVELHETLELERVHMVPAHVPPHREAPGVTADERLRMLELGIGDTPGLVADGRELARSGPSYSVDTLTSLRRELGSQARLVMALGQDAFLKLASWHDPERLFELAHLVVIERPDHPASPDQELRALIEGREVVDRRDLFARPAGGLLRLRLPSRMAISATDLRRRLYAGRSVRYLLPSSVESYIVSRNLYR